MHRPYAKLLPSVGHRVDTAMLEACMLQYAQSTCAYMYIGCIDVKHVLADKRNADVLLHPLLHTERKKEMLM